MTHNTTSKNIKANLLRLSITIHDEWDGETTIEF